MIKNIILTNFRNHTMSRIKTDGAQTIVILGPNGSGKTATIEAISMLSGERGMRGADMGEIARFNGDGSFAVYSELNDESNVSVYFNPGDTNRHAKMDNENIPLSNLANKLKVVWLTPKEDRLFVDSVSDRRAFFDRLCCAFNSTHAGRVAKLNKLLTERANVLKTKPDDLLLNILDDDIASTSVAICDTRIAYAGALNYYLEKNAISLNGFVEEMLISGLTPGDTERKYRQYLSQTRELVGDKMVIDGPHKSDFGMVNNILKLPVSLTSTGQQKMALFDLILAHAKLLKDKSKGGAIILLDEAVAHLDTDARRELFENLTKCDAQIWATGIDAEMFKFAKNAIFVTCQNGSISNIVKHDV
ncbi:MAG: AAA family ATPase [Alphaproteobacteria bacterium]|nr:AAA family ATPase [Alphaproteobacteria bacterium]